MSNNIKRNTGFVSLLILFLGMNISCAKGAPTQGNTNVALGRTVQFAPAPNYRLTATGDSDATDLTDGKVSQRKDQEIWREQSAVGWSYAGRVNLAVDLGKQCSINEISIRLVGGSVQPGIAFPGWVEAFVSDDGEHYSKVAEFSRWNKGDFQKFGVPAEAGKAWVHHLRFQHLNTQGRWVGLRIYTNGVAVSDELSVFGSSVVNQTESVTSGRPSGFSVTHPQPYFHKPYLEVATNVPLPIPIGLIVPKNNVDSKFSMELDLPKGLELRGGSLFSIASSALSEQTLADGGKQYKVTLDKTELKKGSANKVAGRLYLQASGWKDKQSGEIHYRYSSGSWQSPQLSIPVHAVTVPAAPRLKKIMAGLGWWNATGSVVWPDVLQTWRTLGLNTFPVIGNSMPVAPDDPAWKLLDKARQEGFFISNIDSPIARMPVDLGKRHPEIYCQFADGTIGKRLCPSYRGVYYQREIQRFAKIMAKVKPHFSSEDIELWGWRGPLAEAKRCTRCQADFKASGLASWEDWEKAKGLEMWRDLITAARQSVKTAGGPAFETGGYDFRPGEAYQQVWDTTQLFNNKLLDISQVSTYSNLYPYHWAMIGDRVRKDKAALPKAHVMPWISPGDAGVFPGDAFQWTLLECYTNGADGIWFWSHRMWDAEDLIAYNRVIRAIAPVENIITDGQLIGDAATIQSPGRLSGMKLGNRMVLLAADYQKKSNGILKLHLNLPKQSSVRDLLSGAVIKANLSAGDHELSLPLNGEPARLLEIAPN